MGKQIAEIGTLLNHETEPHCCGCWTIQYGNNEVGLRAMCNECGKVVDLTPALCPTPVGPKELAEAVAALEWSLRNETFLDNVAFACAVRSEHLLALLRHARAPRLGMTEEQGRVLRGVGAMLILDWGTPQAHSIVDTLRAAFAAELGEVDRG